MRLLTSLGACALLLSLAPAAWAVPGTVTDDFSLGAGIVFYGQDRVYHATTRCRELDYHECGHGVPGWPENKVIVTRATRRDAQLLIDYHPFGRPLGGDSLLAPTRLSTSLVTSFGLDAEDRKLIDGVGLGYTMAALDAFHRHRALTLEVGGVWLSDVHVLRPDEHPGRVSQAVAPTEHRPMTAAMVTVALAL